MATNNGAKVNVVRRTRWIPFIFVLWLALQAAQSGWIGLICGAPAFVIVAFVVIIAWPMVNRMMPNMRPMTNIEVVIWVIVAIFAPLPFILTAVALGVVYFWPLIQTRINQKPTA